MGQARSNPFRGFVGVMSEMNRIREVGRGGYEPASEDRERTQASAIAADTQNTTSILDL